MNRLHSTVSRAPVAPPRIAVVVMGVSGSGKSTIGAGIAESLGLHFIDGDALHSPESVAKMQAGTPLQDDDRWPWLDRIGACLADSTRWPRGVVIACSALKRAYRDRIRAAAPGVRFVFLDGTEALIHSRLAGRSGHYMPSALLASQLRTLEVPSADEGDVQRLGVELAANDIVERAVLALKSGFGAV
ncbi:MAG: gluconokinase [Pseudomonadota bacterium]|nr:gluconokinase [Pseudomonadota bacterium]